MRDGVLSDDRHIICKLLLDQFSSVFSTPDPNRVVSDPDIFFSLDGTVSLTGVQLTTISITEATITDAIREISISSAPGPDGLQASLFKNCAQELVTPLKIFFNKSFYSGSIPNVLKRAAIVPIFKSGDKTLPSNYRPISLTPILMKIMERIIRKQIVQFLTENSIYNTTQHGFREGRSCLSALLSVYDDILLSLADGSSCVDMIYLDFAKAFDKVDHGILLHKLRDIGITGRLGVWFYHFLSDRSQFVRVAGGTSTDGPVISGVPQGTVLGPLLFTILMLNIDSGVRDSRIISFADDTRLYSNITCIEQCDFLQTDLNTVYEWATVNNMMFNSNKFNYMSFHVASTVLSSNAYTDPDMNLIDQTDHIKDLGITMSYNCDFEQHILSLCKRCSNLSGWILRTFVSRDSDTMLILFKSLVLSRLEYGSQLWSPYKIKHITAVEKIQRSFTKHISGMRDLSYAERLCALRLYSLQRRRERYIIIYVWKILESMVPNLSKPIEYYTSDRRGRLCIVSHTCIGHLGTLLYNSFRFRAIRLLNSMPMSIRNLTCCSVISFKSKLDLYLSNICDNPCIPNIDNSLENVFHTNF